LLAKLAHNHLLVHVIDNNCIIAANRAVHKAKYGSQASKQKLDHLKAACAESY
jgi:hypothetical protein